MLLASAATGLTILATRNSSAAVPIIAESISKISLQDRYYCGWPTLARTKTGELLVVYSGGRESHVCPFGRVEMIRSSDAGKSWSWPRILSDGPIDDRDAGILVTSKGSILVTTFTSLAYESILNRAEKNKSWEEARLAQWQAVQKRISANQRQQEIGTWMLRSVDNGVQWSGRFRCPVNSPHGPVQLSDGRLLYAGKQLWTENNAVGVSVSEDDGQTWKWLAAIPTRDGDQHQKYHELHAVECVDGRLIAHIRNHNQKNVGETLQSESTDGGETWSQPRSIGVWGLPSFLLRLADDRLLMSYGYRRKPFGNQARISSDNGKTWADPITISDDGASGDLGYPSTVQMDDESLVSVWYEKPAESARAVLRMKKWKLHD